jgi:hypothetical protein
MWISRDFSMASCFMKATMRFSSWETCSSLRPWEVDIELATDGIGGFGCVAYR